MSVGKKKRSRPADRSVRWRGFTLLEIMIALAIGTLVLGACIPAFLNWSAERKLRGPVNELAKMVARARFDSLTTGNSASVQLTDEAIVYGKARVALDPAVRLRYRAPHDADWQVVKASQLKVYASGLCEPWLIEFALADGSYVRNRVDPLTGFFEEEESFIR